MNLKTFEKLLEIKFSNNEKLNIEFSFDNLDSLLIVKTELFNKSISIKEKKILDCENIFEVYRIKHNIKCIIYEI